MLKRGFSLLEFVLVIGIASLLLGFISFNLSGSFRSTSIDTTISKLIADMNVQREKAMVGGGDGISGASFGVYFQQDKYILFRGLSFSPSDTSNFTVALDKNTSLTNITFPQGIVVFSQRSGEVAGFVPENNTISVRSADGLNTKTVKINRLGTVYEN